MRYLFKIGEQQVQVAPRSMADELVLSIGDRDCKVVFDHGRDGRCSLQMDGVEYESWVARDGDDIYMKLDGRYFKVTAIDPRAAAAGGGAGEGSVKAPMPGVVVEVLVAEGDAVVEGTKLMTIESMKLQSTISAPCDGVVASLRVEAGSEFDKDAVLVEIESESE